MSRRRKSEDQFCSVCGVSLDLHPNQADEADPGCSAARRKAGLLDRFWAIGQHAR